jgi:hypothetical protein
MVIVVVRDRKKTDVQLKPWSGGGGARAKASSGR